MTAAGEVISDFITDQLETVRARRSSLENRGITVVTSSGVLVTLQFAFASTLYKSSSDPGLSTKILVAISGIFFLAAAVAGVLSNVPRRIFHMNPQSLSEQVSDAFWDAPDVEARKAVAAIRLQVLTSLDEATARKGRVVLIAFGLEIAAIACLASSVIITVFAA
ncbi:hypothetical protein [Streptomyces sp. NPDC049040]|uniref:hypothetical protein n=1 Tax=Streptomyces sp. NPDC049040 TaxID=3365593 RepID=UPI00371BE1F6